jgi:hypothetical protein
MVFDDVRHLVCDDGSNIRVVRCECEDAIVEVDRAGLYVGFGAKKADFFEAKVEFFAWRILKSSGFAVMIDCPT